MSEWAIRSKKIAKKSVILFLVCFIYDKKNWKMSELLIRSFLGKKRAIRSEIKWAFSQPCYNLF